MFIYIHKYMYKIYYVKVLGNPFDDNFGPFLLNLSWEVTFDIPMSDRLRRVWLYFLTSIEK
jgi:hypothetical protein